MYQEYEPKYYSTIKEVVLNFTNKLFGTKSIENKIDIKVLPLFEDNYIGVNIVMEFPDESGLGFELYKQPLIPEEVQATTYSGRRLLLQADTYTS